MAIDIQVGDRVLRQNIRSRQRKGGKLNPDYLGPYTVINVEGKSIDVVDDEGKQIPKINIDHLIIFLEDPPPKVQKFCPPATVSSVPHVRPQSPVLQAPLKFMPFLHPVTLPYTHLSLQHVPLPLNVLFPMPLPHVVMHPGTQCSVLFNPTPTGPSSSKSISAACLDPQPTSSPASQSAPLPGFDPQPCHPVSTFTWTCTSSYLQSCHPIGRTAFPPNTLFFSVARHMGKENGWETLQQSWPVQGLYLGFGTPQTWGET
ncbi:unnamed protein product [Leuciscus chuanchicus]